ncbi:MAG: DNA-protecting protein DprA, partial [Clostridia bacterium]|nr:DNA-protecting protein DprA [Clostridia bacterium]
RTADELSREGADPADVLASLTTLEIRGLIRSLPGGRYERADR